MNEYLHVWETISTGQGESHVGRVTRSDVARGIESALWVCDTNTAPLLPSEIPLESCVVVPSGEASKDWPEVHRVLETALRRGMDRNSVFVAFGGGVICDLTAFAASIYLRGVQVVLIPTTLLAMVDAAVGGKTGINFSGYKNMVGTFHTASEVRVCESYLATLTDEEYYSGLAEAIKAAVLGDASLLSMLEESSAQIKQRDPTVLLDVCRRAIHVKADIVRADYRESGARAYLNFGHTFAHALETVSGFGTWTHGAAVAWGMAQALELGVKAGHTPDTHASRIIGLLQAYGYHTAAVEEDTSALISAMSQDKKRAHGDVRFVLSRGIGDTVVTPVPEDVLRRQLG